MTLPREEPTTDRHDRVDRIVADANRTIHESRVVRTRVKAVADLLADALERMTPDIDIAAIFDEGMRGGNDRP